MKYYYTFVQLVAGNKEYLDITYDDNRVIACHRRRENIDKDWIKVNSYINGTPFDDPHVKPIEITQAEYLMRLLP